MAKNELFSEFRTEVGRIKLTKWNMKRKVGSSLRDWKNSNVRMPSWASSNKGKRDQVVTVTADGLNRVSQGVTIANIGFASAAIAITATGATVVGITAVMTGPGLAIAAGIVGLGLLVKEKYSNRETQHEILQAYVWNLIDDERPAIPINDKEAMQKAANAAIYLMKEADSQFKQLSSKLTKDELEFEGFIKLYLATLSTLSNDSLSIPINGNLRSVKTIMSQWPGAYSDDEKENLAMTLQSHYFTCNTKLNDANAMWDKAAKKPNGEVFNYMRRLIHVSNYLQCAGIIERAIYMTINKEHVKGIKDPLNRLQFTGELRKKLHRIEVADKEARDNYKEFEHFLEHKVGSFQYGISSTVLSND